MNDLVPALNLQPHPKGGWYRETYRALETVASSGLPSRFDEQRSHASAIYFLLNSESFSALHRLKSDEQWHFHSCSPLTVHVIHPNGSYAPVKLGPDLVKGETFQAVVPHGYWFGATVDTPDSYAVVGCSITPGFDFADLNGARRTFM